MRKPTSLDLDWENLDDIDLPKELSFVEPDSQPGPGEQRELEEFLREYQEDDSVIQLLEIYPEGEDEPDT